MMSQRSIILGYHGCDREIGERVLAGDLELRPSANAYDWLAEGIYLWENDAQRALHWAQSLLRHEKMSPTRIRDPFILGVVVDLGTCLDLLQAQGIRLVSDAYADLKALYLQLGATAKSCRFNC
jgi:hypothetical protein